MNVVSHLETMGEASYGLLDGELLYLLTVVSDRVLIYQIDLENFETIEIFDAENGLHPVAKGCLDGDFLYLPSVEGQILYIDRFSGHVVNTSDTIARYVVSEIWEFGGHLYALLGIPLAHPSKVSTNHYALVSIDKSDGHIRFQSEAIKGRLSRIASDPATGEVYMGMGNSLIHFDHECRVVARTKTRLPAYHVPLITDDYVGVSGAVGVLEIYKRRSLEGAGRLSAGNNLSSPVNIGTNMAAWFTRSGVMILNLELSSAATVTSTPAIAVSDPALHDGAVYAGDQTGHIVAYHTVTSEMDRLKIAPTPMSEPMISGDHLYCHSGNKLHKIGGLLH
jgi:hypothetical protein